MKTTIRLTCLAAAMACAFPVAAQTNAKPKAPTQAQTNAAMLEEAERLWGVFPLSRLRPEQVIGAMLQSNSVRTIDQNSHLFTRAVRFFQENNFITEFGDPGEHELQDRPGTITQALLYMNGSFAAGMSETSPLSTPLRVDNYSPTPEKLVENAYLAVLTRKPTLAEQTHFVTQLNDQEQDRGAVIQDLFWALFNSTEFCWNH